MSLLQNPYLVGMAGLLLGALAGYGLWRFKENKLRHAIKTQERESLDQARCEAEAIAKEARLLGEAEALKLRDATAATLDARHQEIHDAEKRLNERESFINRQLEKLDAAEDEIKKRGALQEKRSEALAGREQELEKLCRHRREELQQLAHLTEQQARDLLLKEVEHEVLKDAHLLSRRILDQAQSHAEEKARHIIGLAIQRYAGDHVNDISSATVTLPSEDLKGRIIGREGRNIRAFESATGVTVLIDDTPNAIVLSAFDPVRRMIAREAMNRLLADGRIHPTRIEEVVKKVNEEMEETVLRCGEEAIQRAGVAPAHPEVTRLLGRLRFRFSYSQNVLDHSVEVAHLTGLLAGELGLCVSNAKRAGLLHDIGKAVTHEIPGAHALVGSEILRRYGEPEEVVNAVASHHDEAAHHGPLGILVSAADAMSASRPGARSETMTAYLRRVESLERLGSQMPGVQRCFAVQAGRELRVLVQPEEITDDEAHLMARRLTKRIEEELQYPGQIRVTVVRETRCIEYAK